jgi:hypothetical protein
VQLSRKHEKYSSEKKWSFNFFELLSGIFRKVDFSTFSQIFQKLLKIKHFFGDSDREWSN